MNRTEFINHINVILKTCKNINEPREIIALNELRILKANYDPNLTSFKGSKNFINDVKDTITKLQATIINLDENSNLRMTLSHIMVDLHNTQIAHNNNLSDGFPEQAREYTRTLLESDESSTNFNSSFSK